MTILVADAGLLGLKNMCPLDWELRLYSGRQISKGLLDGADALIVRSTTQVLADELPSSIRFLGTATIGTDHLPLDALSERDVNVVSARGCNAAAVVDYVLWHLIEWANLIGEEIRTLTLGVIGVGEVGKRLVAQARRLGLTVLQSDLPRYEKGDLDVHCTIEEVMTTADIVSLHVPFSTKGRYQTLHLIDHYQISSMKSRSLLINAARGKVLCEDAVLSRCCPYLVLDVFPEEPFISDVLLERSWRITPHIAGHSAEGKLNGTRMILDAYSKFKGAKLLTFDREQLLLEVAGLPPKHDDLILRLKEIDNFHQVNAEMRNELLTNTNRRIAFDIARNRYQLRRETTSLSSE